MLEFVWCWNDGSSFIFNKHKCLDWKSAFFASVNLRVLGELPFIDTFNYSGYVCKLKWFSWVQPFIQLWGLRLRVTWSSHLQQRLRLHKTPSLIDLCPSECTLITSLSTQTFFFFFLNTSIIFIQQKSIKPLLLIYHQTHQKESCSVGTQGVSVSEKVTDIGCQDSTASPHPSFNLTCESSCFCMLQCFFWGGGVICAFGDLIKIHFDGLSTGVIMCFCQKGFQWEVSFPF